MSDVPRTLLAWLKEDRPSARCSICSTPLPAALEDLQQMLDAGWWVTRDAKAEEFFCPGCAAAAPWAHGDLPPTRRHPASQRFHEILNELAALHDRKQADYGRESDPFANVRASEDFGIPGWVGAVIRANDKMRRLMKAAAGGEMANESVVDSFDDLAVYAVIARVLYEEEQSESR